MRLTGDEARTRDVLQEVFVRLAKSPRILEDVAGPRSYLLRMAHRLVIDGSRRDQARRHYSELAAQEVETVSVPDADGGDAAWVRARLATVLDSLPDEQRAAVVLKVGEEMTFAQIAEVLEIPANTAASRYRYALDKMREELRPHYEDLP